MSDDSDEQRQCRRGVGVHELDAAMALADLAGVSPEPQKLHLQPAAGADSEEDEEMASTGLSLELGKVGIHSSSPCSSTSSAGHHRHHPAQQQQVQAPVSVYGSRPRHNMLTEAEKEAKRLRRVLANRESARQTILRRQAIRDELARKVADLSSQNERMKKEKDMVTQEYLSLKEENKQLKEQVARTTKKAPAAAPPSQQAVAPSAASPQTTPPQPSFLSTVAPPTVPVPYVWGSWPPTTGHEHAGSPLAPAPLRLAPCAWYYPAAAVEPTSGGGSPAGAETADEDTDDDPCSLTLAIDLDKRSAPIAIGSSRAAEAGQQVGTERDKAVTTAEARKRRKELTKLKHMHATAGRPGGEQW